MNPFSTIRMLLTAFAQGNAYIQTENMNGVVAGACLSDAQDSQQNVAVSIALVLI